MRPDDPESMKKHAGRYTGGTAIVVLGGYSAKNWESLYAKIQPDVILIGNGVNSQIQNANYWLCAENMTYANNMAMQGDPDNTKKMEMFHREAGAKVKLISHRSWGLLRDTSNCISIRRDKTHGFGPGKVSDYFSFREYGEGFLNGWLFNHREAGKPVHVGTVGTHLLHLAGILGCAEVHTIGFDLIFKDNRAHDVKHHHWYDYPAYDIDIFRKSDMFIDYKGLKTQWVWIETMLFLEAIQPLFVRDGLKWYDHSDGLLQMEGIAQ